MWNAVLIFGETVCICVWGGACLCDFLCLCEYVWCVCLCDNVCVYMCGLCVGACVCVSFEQAKAIKWGESVSGMGNLPLLEGLGVPPDTQETPSL